MDDLSKLVIGSPKPDDDKCQQIWAKIPHTSMDNHFSANPAVKYIGEMGGKSTWTTARGRFPESIQKGPTEQEGPEGWSAVQGRQVGKPCCGGKAR